MSKTERELKYELEYDYKLEPISEDDIIKVYNDVINSGADALSTPLNVAVNKPSHYNQGGIETIDYMKAYSTKEEFMGHLRLTSIKYLSRLMEKENPLQDAMKARWYLNKLIDELQE